METSRIKEADILAISGLFSKVYGPDYPFKEFYDTHWLTKSAYSDDTITFVARENNEVIGMGSAFLAAGAYADLIGEFGRLVVNPEIHKKGIGSEIISKLLDDTSEIIQFGFAECRTVHVGAQKIMERHGFATTGFEPLKYRLVERESPVFVTRLFEPALNLRKNNPRVISEIYPLASLSLQNLELSSDVIVEDETDGYPIDTTFEIEELHSEGMSTILRIERGRVKNPEVFGNLSLSYGFFKIATNKATYIVAKHKGIVLGAIGFTIDNVDQKIKVFELIESDDEVKGFLLSELVRMSADKYGAEYIEIDISAYSPKMQRTLDRLGFIAVAYCPSMVFRGTERLDIVRMAKLNIPAKLGEVILTEANKDMFQLVMKDLETKKIGIQINDATRKLDIFTGLSDTEFAQLVKLCQMITYPAGQVISKQGDRGADIFVLTEGKASVVNVVNDEKKLIGFIKPGEIFGEMSIIEDLPRMAELVADVESRVITINRQELSNLMTRNNHLGKMVMHNIARGLSKKLRRSESA